MEQKVKKREWVKNAAIIFLAVMLVLTFFSNTIMNRSIPEVATSYVESGKIDSKVRISGTVTANENYDVVLDQSRKVASVAVKVGQEVSVGDLLFTLEPGDSGELEDAKDLLHELELQYSRALINASQSDYARENRDIAKAREALVEAQAERDALALTKEQQAEFNTKLADAQQIVADALSAIDAQNTLISGQEALIEEQNAKIKTLKQAVKDQQKIVGEKQKAVDLEEENVSAYRKVLDAAQQKLNQYAGGSYADYSAVSAAKAALEEAKQNVENAKTALETAKVLYGADYARLEDYAREMMTAEYNRQADALRAQAEADYRAAHSEISPENLLTPEQQAEVDAAANAQIAKLPTLEKFISNNMAVYLPAAAEQCRVSGNTEKEAMYNAYQKITEANAAITAAENAQKQAKSVYDSVYDAYSEVSSRDYYYSEYQKEVDAAQKDVDTAQKKLDAANAVLKKANEALADAQDAVDTAQEALVELDGDLDDLKTALQEKESALADAEQAVSDLKAEEKAHTAEYNAASDAVGLCEDALADLLFNLEQQKNADSKTQQLEALERKELQAQIDDAKEEVASLSGDGGDTEVKAKVSGVVQSLSVSAGHMAAADTVLATIELPDLGYSMTATVSVDQARLLHVGDSAAISNYYWGSATQAEITGIQPDHKDPRNSKLIVFNITGNVNVGDSLSFSIGEKNASYDYVVPNSAVRSDTSGSFVLTITAKNSPLGNRYYATRVDVEVLASDDFNSAINGALNSMDSVITTSSKNAPVSNGDQVRLSDTN